MSRTLDDGARLNQRIEELVAEHLPAITSLRRRLHAHPETAFEEVQTARTLAEFLQPLGLPTRFGVGGEGIVALIEGGAAAVEGAWPERPVIALRADLDALDVTEQTGLPYASQIEGKMHACGHDMHMATVAGATSVLAALRDILPGTVKIIFQPAEESASRMVPGVDPFREFRRGLTGAQRMLEEGVLEQPRVDAIVGLHCWPDLSMGTIGLDPRAAMAGNGVLRVRVLGKGGHGATPHQTVDPVPVAATMILALQTMVSRFNNPADPLVLSITTLRAGTAVNVIPEKVEFQATIRSLRPGYIEGELGERITGMVRSMAEAYGAGVDVTCGAGLPVTVNDPRMVAAAQQGAAAILGAANVVTMDSQAMTSEDFAYFAQHVPGVYIKVGVAGPEGCPPLHNPAFAPNEGALAVGIKALVRLAFDLCRTGLGRS